MNSRHIARFLAIALGSFSGLYSVQAHPLPEIPVWSFFEKEGKTRIEIEIDPRCFTDDPEEELYMLYWYLQRCDEAEKEEMFDLARKFIPTRLDLLFNASAGVGKPDFNCEFTTLGGRPLKALDDPVVIRAVWETTLPSSVVTYQVKAHKIGIYSVLFLNHVNDEAVPRIQTLFPGEESYILDLTAAK
ncbi:MAG: hypothetical protein P1U58_17270 [Verrucomicrobiales bacterium]|nr:hypothetical protein [Verrucomicrobiales bacterium]